MRMVCSVLDGGGAWSYKVLMNEDAELLRRFAETHAEDAFACLVQRHLGLVFHTALRRTNGDAHRAQDIAQQVFTELARDARTVSNHPVLSGWLYVTTRHLAANAMRAEHRRKQREEVAHRLQDPPPTAPSAWDQLRPELDAVMEELSAPDRDAVLLRFFEDQSYAHIGAALDVSEDAARMRVDRALDKLRGLLAHRGIESTAAALGAALVGHAAGAAPAGLATTVTGAALGSLTVAAAGAATTGTLWTFMTTTKTLAGVAGAIACMGIGAGLYEASGFSPAEKELAELSVQLAQSNAKLIAATETAGVVQAASTIAPKAVVAGQTAAKASGPNVSPAGNTLNLLAGDPEYHRLSMEMFKADLPTRLSMINRKLGLSSDKLASLGELLTEQQQINGDMMAAARAQGLSLTDPNLRKLSTDLNASIVQRIRDLIGSEAYDSMLSFNRLNAARRSVDTVVTGLFYSDDPLQTAQAEKLVEIVHAQTAPDSREGLLAIPGQTDWNSVASQAESFLSPSQTEALRRLGKRMQAQTELAALQQSLNARAKVGP